MQLLTFKIYERHVKKRFILLLYEGNCEKVMKNRSCILLILPITMGILINSSNPMSPVNTQGGENAYFTKVEYPESKIYQANKDEWSYRVCFTVYNVNCAVDTSGRAWFFFKFYRNDELWWNEYNNTLYKTWQCNKSSTVRREYVGSIPVWRGPETHDFKIELYWDCEGTHCLQDTTSFTITCVLFIHSLLLEIEAMSYLSVYSFIIIGLIFYLLLTRPFEF